jgi:hypothetical protein
MMWVLLLLASFDDYDGMGRDVLDMSGRPVCGKKVSLAFCLIPSPVCTFMLFSVFVEHC